LNARELSIPRGGGAIGQANVFYPHDGLGKQRNLLWLEQIVDFIDAYDGENLLQTTKGGPEEAAVKGAEVVETRWAGQGFLQASAVRQAIEQRAMTVAERYFLDHGWGAENHSASKPYDLLATKNEEETCVEVKGTQGDGSAIFLTPREVKWAREQHPCTALVVVTGIQVSDNEGQIEAQGGELHIMQPWYPDDASLEPLAYKFQTGLGVNS
jgi:hypothetical protein